MPCAAVERLLVLQLSADYIFIYYGINETIIVASKIEFCLYIH